MMRVFGIILGAEKYYLETCFSEGSDIASQALSQE